MVHFVEGIKRPKKEDCEKHSRKIRRHTVKFLDDAFDDSADSHDMLREALHSANTLNNYIQSAMGGRPEHRRDSAETPSDSDNEGTGRASKVPRMKASKKQRRDDTTSDGTASDDTASDGTASDDTASDGTASDDTASDDTTSEVEDISRRSKVSRMTGSKKRSRDNNTIEDKGIPKPSTKVCLRAKIGDRTKAWKKNKNLVESANKKSK